MVILLTTALAAWGQGFDRQLGIVSDTSPEDLRKKRSSAWVAMPAS
jgi:hypothetical protein